MRIAPEVAEAIAGGRPVVALESTLVSHGLPRPRNLEVAREVEAAVRRGGAVPATIAVLDGEVRVGLDEAALEQVAGRDDVLKCSVRDLAPLVARGGPGPPRWPPPRTWPPARVSGCSPPAASAGYTGARGSPGTSRRTWCTLARTGIVVVCAGVKSILDVGPRSSGSRPWG